MKYAKYKLLASMLLFGSIGLFTRAINLPAAQLVVWRIWLGCAFLALTVWVTKPAICKTALKKQLPILLFAGAAMGANWLFLFEAYRYTSVSMATLAYYCAPVFIVVASIFLFREKLSGASTLCIAAIVGGMVLLSRVEGTGIDPTKGLCYGLAAAVLYATVVLCSKTLHDIPATVITLCQLCGAAAVMTPYALLTQSDSWSMPYGIALVCVLTLGIVHTGIAYVLYFGAVQWLPAQTAAVYSYLDPLSALFFSAVFLQERLSAWQWVGAVLILGGAFLHGVIAERRNVQ